VRAPAHLRLSFPQARVLRQAAGRSGLAAGAACEPHDAGAPRRFAPSPTRLDDTSMVIVTQKHVFSLADDEDVE